MWRDWPEPLQPRATGNDLLAPLLIHGEQWQPTVPPAQLPKQRWVAYPDSTFVVMTHEGSNYLWQYMLTPEGLLTHGQRFYWLHSYDNTILTIGPMSFDANGNLWVVTNAGIQICDQNGRVRGIITLPWQIDVGEIIDMEIIDGQVTLSLSNGTALGRRFNVTAPTPGVRPKSQGQG